MDNKERAAKISLQIEKRLEVLSSWVADGVPEGYQRPTSLNKVREWSDKELGIEKIGSPSSFTTSHKVYGHLVIKISNALNKLNTPAKKKPPTNPVKQLQKLRGDHAEYEKSLTNAANQYTSMRVDLDKYQLLYRVARQSQEDAQHELLEAENTVRELKAELVRERAKSGNKKATSIALRVVKDHAK